MINHDIIIIICHLFIQLYSKHFNMLCFLNGVFSLPRLHRDM